MMRVASFTRDFFPGALGRYVGHSVFSRLPKGASMETILAAMFHRASATLYFIYAVWAAITTLDGVPSLVAANGEQWQIVFSLTVLIFAAPACFGATFWPSFARLELYAGAGFCSLMVIYIFFLVGSALFGDGSWGGTVIISSVLVVAACRVVIVIILLLRQAEDRKAKIAARLAALAAESGE